MRFGMLVSLALAAPAAADSAVPVAAGAPDTIFPNTSTTHGWQFSVNAPLEVTHLGLYDRLFDGFAIAHPIGLWDEEGTLLAEDVLGPGAGDTLIDNFRYVDITDNTEGGQGVILTPGQQYTIGFFSASFNQIDGMVIFDGFHTVNPAVDYVGFGVADVTGGLQMPVTPSSLRGRTPPSSYKQQHPFWVPCLVVLRQACEGPLTSSTPVASRQAWHPENECRTLQVIGR
jgi:hypothetical protein